MTAHQQAAAKKDDEDDDDCIIMSNKGAVQTCILCCNCVMLYLKQWESKCYVPVGAAQRQTIACSCNIWHFVAEGPAEMMVIILSTKTGVSSFCGLCHWSTRAHHQMGTDLSHEEMSQHPFRSQHLQAELRQKAAGLLQTDPWLEKHMSGLQDNAFPGYSKLCSEHCLRPEVPVSQLFASAIINDKAWAGAWCAKALAIVVQHNLVVISTHGLVLYSKSNDPDSRMKCVECCYIGCPCGAHTRRNDRRRDMLSEVLHADT